ncbi:MAG: hypothetical protein NT085_01790 [candidate division SR1 bacterium]|nr:hypothetical protein [candidate division SR1 bacterium]
MEKTEIQQSQELEKIKLSLGNNLLDANERKFLQSQEKLVLDFKEKTEQLLLQDIKAANEKSLISTANMRMAINWMLLSPEGFINQLSVSGKLGTNPMLISNTKIALRQIMVDKTITQIDKKMFLISILLDAKDGPINLVTYKALADSKLKNMTSGTLVKKIHAFQKIGKGSDCVIDESTLGQLCALSGIVPPQGETLTTFNIKTTEKSFSYASQAWDAMEKIVKNTSFTNVQKVTTLLDIRNKTSADKKYAATSYLMTFTQDILKNATVQEKTEIELLISQSQSDIAKYRNADESNDLVVKTNDIMKDINKGVEQKEQKIKSIESLHTIAGIRESFYKSYDKHLYEKKGQGITTGIAMLEKTKTAFAAGTISEFMCDAQVSYAMKKIFVSIEEDTESEIKVDVTITKDKDGNEYHVENTHQAWHNIQLKMFQSLPGLFQEGNTKEIATQIFGLIRNYDRGFINVMEATGIEYGELVEQGITQTTSFVDEMETVFAKGAKNNILLIKNFVATLKSLLNPAKRAELVNLMSAPATSTEQIITFLRGLKLGIDDQLEDLAKDLIKNSMLSIKNSVAALKIFLADAAAGGKVEKLVNLMSAPATSTEQIITGEDCCSLHKAKEKGNKGEHHRSFCSARGTYGRVETNIIRTRKEYSTNKDSGAEC